MTRKKIIIFITVFVAVGLIILGLYLLSKKTTTTTSDGSTPWYQNFNPFGTSNENTNNQGQTNPDIGTNQPGGLTGTQTSRFYQITDFAIAGATFLEDIRPIVTTQEENKPEEIKTLISTDTKEGRQEIQKILNDTLSLKVPLVTDGNFGKLTTEAIKEFQKLKNLTITGKIDSETAPFFVKITTTNDLVGVPKYEQAPSVRYVERMNGHIYKMFLDNKAKEKISNSTIPGIYEAFFDSIGQTVIYRYLSEDKIVTSFMATLGAPKGEFLPQNISDLSISQNKTNFFYISESGGGVTGVTGTFGSTKRNIVFNSPFTEWLSQWTTGQKLFLTTKASYGVNGSIFLLDTTNKTLSKVFGGIMGLTTTVNPSGSLILYSGFSKTGPRLGIFDINRHTTKDLGIYGLPEKCVWSKDNITIYCAVPNTIIGNQYPDYWYQGLISFDDYFVKIDTNTLEKVTIANSISETPVDGTHLFLDDKENSLFFTNKKDSTLWGLDIK